MQSVPTASRGVVSSAANLASAEEFQEISRALKGLEHGEITIKVHDGKVVLIERIARLRPRRQNVLPASDR